MLRPAFFFSLMPTIPSNGSPKAIQMAVWQFDVKLIPEGAVVAVCGCVPERVQTEAHGTEWWDETDPPEDFADRLTILLGPSAPADWSSELRIWGQMPGDRVDVFYVDGKICDIRARIDVREPDTRFVEGMVALADHCECVFVTKESAIIQAGLSDLCAAIAASSSARFTADPYGYLRSLKQPD